MTLTDLSNFDLNKLGIIFGFVSSALILLVTVWRQRRFEMTDIGAIAVSYFPGSNLPPAVLLCSYGIYPDPQDVMTKLHGLEKYVTFSGWCLFLISLVAIWGALLRAYTTPTP